MACAVRRVRPSGVGGGADAGHATPRLSGRAVQQMALGQKPHVEQPFQAARQARKPAPRVTFTTMQQMLRAGVCAVKNTGGVACGGIAGSPKAGPASPWRTKGAPAR